MKIFSFKGKYPPYIFGISTHQPPTIFCYEISTCEVRNFLRNFFLFSSIWFRNTELKEKKDYVYGTGARRTKLRPNTQDIPQKCGGRTSKKCINVRWFSERIHCDCRVRLWQCFLQITESCLVVMFVCGIAFIHREYSDLSRGSRNTGVFCSVARHPFLLS